MTRIKAKTVTLLRDLDHSMFRGSLQLRVPSVLSRVRLMSSLSIEWYVLLVLLVSLQAGGLLQRLFH